MKKRILLASTTAVAIVTTICLFITTLAHVNAEVFNAFNTLERMECIEEETEEEKQTTETRTNKQNDILRYNRSSEDYYIPRYLGCDDQAYTMARIKKNRAGSATEAVENEAETAKEVARSSAPHYSIAGHVMPLEWQDYLYAELQKYGTEKLAPYLQAQAFQESRFNTYDITNNLDYGLFQYRITWWKHHCEQAGIYGNADIFNPYTQIKVRAFLASKVYLETGSIEAVMKRHINGGDERNERYWKHEILPWFEQIERIG